MARLALVSLAGLYYALRVLPESVPCPPAYPGVFRDEETWTGLKASLRIAAGDNDILVDKDGRRLIDLFSGNGTAWVGHANSRVAERLAAQVKKIWITGGLETAIHREAVAAIEALFPPSHVVGGLCSTGMEAAEFALRIARRVTGRQGVVGFERSMHGKSLAAAYLGWDNQDRVCLPQFVRLPFVSTLDEKEILKRLRAVLEDRSISAVFVEPLQGSGGGHAGSDLFYQAVFDLCREFGTLLVFDEILTGFYRTGRRFYFEFAGIVPDLVLVGKAMGNGFPVSGVVLSAEHRITPQMLPGSTYAANPLACSAIVGTLQELETIRPAEKVAAIEKVILESLSGIRDLGFQLRGRGAMWIIEVPAGVNAEAAALRLYRCGVFLSFTGRILRLLPAVTIDLDRLAEACKIVQEQLSVGYAS